MHASSFTASWVEAAALSTGQALPFWKTQFSRLPTLCCCEIRKTEFWRFGLLIPIQK
jgi:hypothetical protein